jgi:Tfp pilus assembly protein PilF/spermidine synthase
MGDFSQLQYSYERVMAAVTRHFAQDIKKPAFLQLGGGGYVFPRYLEHYWPDSRVDVVEIDPGVTLAAQKAFGLDPKTKINTIPLDARNYIDQIYYQASSGKDAVKYNFIYEDALNNYCVPYQLTTYEFNQKLINLLTDDGIYMVELIDRLDSSLFLGSFVNTVKRTFPFVTVISGTDVSPDSRNTFVVIAAKKPFSLDNVFKESGLSDSYLFMSPEMLSEIDKKSKGMVLTDDYAPVENLLAPVAKTQAASGQSALVELKARKLAEQAEKFAWSGNLSGTLEKVDELIKTDPSMTIKVYEVMARIFADSNRVDDVLQIYQAAANRYSGQQQFKNDFADLNFDWAIFLQKIGKPADSASHFLIAANTSEEILANDPNSAKAHSRLGEIYANIGNFPKAAEHFQKAVDLDPDNVQNHFYLVRSLEAQQLLDKAIERAAASAQYFTDTGKKDQAARMQEYLQYLRQQKSTR